MKTQTASRILLTVLVLGAIWITAIVWADGFTRLAWLFFLGGLVLVVAIWIPWNKVRQPGR